VVASVELVKHPQYVESFGKPEAVALDATRRLREEGAEVVVALTHLPIAGDAQLLRRLGAQGPDLIIGGHEHNRQSEEIGGRRVIKADADARTATVARVTLTANGPPRVEYEFRALDAEVKNDPAVAARVEAWLKRHGREYCVERLQQPVGCLDEPLSRAGVTLVAEELEIRRWETNLGNWILDQALAAFADHGAQAAFVNSGSLRLNQDIPEGSVLTRRHVEETFAYPMPLKLLRIKGSTLREVVSHAVTDWTGNGRWLQIAGFAFFHDPEPESAESLTLITAEGLRPIAPDQELLVVTGDFLADPATGQDGFTMLGPQQLVPIDGPDPDLKELVLAALKAAGEAGIAPEVEGRICNPRRPGWCKALSPVAGSP